VTPHRIMRILRQERLHVLLAEAVWRCFRVVRKRLSRITGPGESRARFSPIGYYESAPEDDRISVLAYADCVLQGEYPLMGYGWPLLGQEPDWHCDWVSGKRWPLDGAEKLAVVRYDGSDVKAPWELSRLQYVPVLAHAWALTGEHKYRDRVKALLTHWVAKNPLGKGVNWTIAMEAALRGISICLSLERLWPFNAEEEPWLEQMAASLWQHLRFIEVHSEFSFRLRSNHYLSNLAGLTSLCAYLRGPGMARRLRKYASALQREVLLQTYADGGDREASTGYHLLVAQMALHSYAVQRRRGCAIAPEFAERLQLMIRWISALVDDTGKLPVLGDCDSGRVELLPDDIAQVLKPALQRHALRTASLQAIAGRLFPLLEPVALLRESGLALLRAGEATVVLAAMPNGLSGKGSHTHCDKLAIVLRLGSDEVFCDSGSRCYTRSPELRNRDRSTLAHSTLAIDGQDQNTIPTDPRMLFQCGDEAAVSPITGNATEVCACHFGYKRMGIVHQRTAHLDERSLVVTDEVSGSGEHVLDLRFVLAPGWKASPGSIEGKTVSCAINGPRRVALICEGEGGLALSLQPAEISREYGTSLPAGCILIHTTATLPTTLRTRVEWK
jgi:hypothetical protein